MSLVGFVTAVTSTSVPAPRSTVNDVILSVLLTFPEKSVTLIVQSEYVPSFKELKVIVIYPGNAEVVPDEQEPP